MKLGSLKLSDSETRDIISELTSERNKLDNTEGLQKLMENAKGQNLLKVSKK